MVAVMHAGYQTKTNNFFLTLHTGDAVWHRWRISMAKDISVKAFVYPRTTFGGFTLQKITSESTVFMLK